MADQKVSDLPSLNGADVDPADLLYIVDSSAGTAGSKKITIGQYQLASVSGGTADGVVYLNASKVETSGSALTFDGTNFATTGTASATKLIPTGGTATGNGMYLPAANTLAWSNNGAETMRLDSSGNLGLGVTPSAGVSSSWAHLNIKSAGSTLRSDGIFVDLLQNVTGDGKYNTTGAATEYRQTAGQHQWLYASSGTAGNAITFTQAMTLDASGNLLVGTTSSSGLITGKNTTFSQYTAYFWNATTTGDAQFVGFGTENTVTSRGSIDYNRAGGLVRYNTTSDYRAKDILGPVADPGATIDALKVYEGLMKGATQSRPMLVAHEAQEHAPYAVSGVKDEVNEDGTPKFQQIDVSSLVPLLIAELQSLRARVAALEAK